MGIFSKLFGSGPDRSVPGEHSVTLCLPYQPDAVGDPADPQEVTFYEQLAREAGLAATSANAGSGQPVCFAEGVCTIAVTGVDADAIWEAVCPVLEPHPLPQGAIAIKRFGPADAEGAHVEQIDVSWAG